MRSSAVSTEEWTELPVAAAAPPLMAVPPANSALAQPSNLERTLQALLDRCLRLQAAQPDIVGLGQMRRRLQQELKFLRKLAAGLGTACGHERQSCGFCVVGGTAAPGAHEPLNACAQLQGVANNAQGLGAELGVAESAPGVVAVSRRFWAAPLQRAAGPEQTHGAAPDAAAASCEVDVVAQRGHAWVEVKSHGLFGLHSSHWLGSAGHTKGLKQQAAEQLAIAGAACNQLRWAPPAVVFHFAGGASAEVAAQLQAMGITVTGQGLITAEQLPPSPPPPAAANADVTTLCALVSEVTNTDPTRPELCEWAARTSHWQECLAAEQQEPLQLTLAPQLAGRRLVAAAPTLQHFGALVAKLGGPREQRRHSGDVTRGQGSAASILNFGSHCNSSDISSRCSSGGVDATPAAKPGGLKPSRMLPPPAPCKVASVDVAASRLAPVQHLSADAKTVLAVGDAAKAVTLTANGRAVAAAASCGVHLETFVHRAVWLAGL